jgi:hypothetical protein
VKNNLPYFSHYNATHDTPKIQALMAEFGMAGYGRYWILCEKVAASPGAILDISNKAVKLAAARSLEFCADEFDGFINFLSDSGIGLVKFENGIITVDQLVENYDRVSKKRQHDRSIYHSGDIPNSEKQVSHPKMSIPTSENIQMKVNENKVNLNKNDDDPEHQKTSSSFFIDTIQEEAKKAGFILDAGLAQKITNSGISSSWITGPHNFFEFAKEKLNDDTKYRDKPHGEKRLLFANTFTWESYRAEFPGWRRQQEENDALRAGKEAVEAARENHPEMCGNCGVKLRRWDGTWVCDSCGVQYTFDENSRRWDYHGPPTQGLSEGFREQKHIAKEPITAPYGAENLVMEAK